MSDDLTFSFPTRHAIRIGQRLSGCILRSFIPRDSYLMPTLFKCVVLSCIEYGTQLWCPYLKRDILALESFQLSFTKHIFGMQDFDYKTHQSDYSF